MLPAAYEHFVYMTSAHVWFTACLTCGEHYVRQVYKPFVCDMREWDLEDFGKCTENTRMIMVGDLSMKQMFDSLACLTRPFLKSGKQTSWEVVLLQVCRSTINITSVFQHELFARQRILTCLGGITTRCADVSLSLQDSELKTDQEYTARSLQPGLHVKKKFVGDFVLDNGLHVFLRSFNVFNLTLWDDVLEPFGELKDDDILVGTQPAA